MKPITLSFLLMALTNLAFGQQAGVAQFVIWKPNEGQQQLFENGYKQHLKWHEDNGDTWGWWGWYFVSGPRYGYFMDATFHRTWRDFDNAVKPAEDRADNNLHVFPFGKIQGIFKAVHYPQYSTADTYDNKLKITRLITLTVENAADGLKLIGQLRDYYTGRQIKSFQTYRVVDGGDLSQFILMLGFDSWEAYGISENAGDKLNEFENALKRKVITSMLSETIAYREDLSWFPKK